MFVFGGSGCGQSLYQRYSTLGYLQDSLRIWIRVPSNSQSFLASLGDTSPAPGLWYTTLDTSIYADTGYHLDGQSISVIYDIFPFLSPFLSELFEISLLWHCISKLQFDTFSYPSGFSCKNKKPLGLKQKGIWYREFTKSLKTLGDALRCGWDIRKPTPGTHPRAGPPVALQPLSQSSEGPARGMQAREKHAVNREYFLKKPTFKNHIIKSSLSNHIVFH